MKIRLTCMQCIFRPDGEARPVEELDFEVARKGYLLPINDAGIYKFTCDAGHINHVWDQSPKYQALANVAVESIIDGYSREAVLSFNGALERFYEHFLRVTAWDQEIYTDFLKVWDVVSRQSERQLGMYLAVHLWQRREPAPVLANKRIEFRNDVVHRGVIPTPEQAIEFGQAVMDVISPVEAYLKLHHERGEMDLLANMAFEAFKKAKMLDSKIQTRGSPSIFGMRSSDGDLCRLEKIIELRQLPGGGGRL